MPEWSQGLIVTISDGHGEVFAIHELGPDEATHMLAEIAGKEATEQIGLDIDRFGDRGAEECRNDPFTTLKNVVVSAKERGEY